MQTFPVTDADQALIIQATNYLKEMFTLEKHRTATLILTTAGEIILGINVEGSFGCIDICAEQATLAKALSVKKTGINTILSVKQPKPSEADQTIKVVSPCGHCREILYDYCPDSWVIVREGQTLSKVQVRDLLPFRYSKN